MGRLTKKIDANYTVQDKEKAIEKLAVFEDMCEEILKEQETLSADLAKLRSENKKNSYRFKELMGKKLTNSNTLTLLKNYGLID